MLNPCVTGDTKVWTVEGVKSFKELAEALGERQERNALLFEKPQEDISEYTESPDEYLKLDIDQFVKAFDNFLMRKKKIEDIKKSLNLD